MTKRERLELAWLLMNLGLVAIHPIALAVLFRA